MVTSTLVSAGVGVVAATCTCAVASAEPGRVDKAKLLLELEGMACRACGLSAGLVSAGSGVFGGADLALLRADRMLSAVSGWRAWCDCADAVFLAILASCNSAV